MNHEGRMGRVDDLMLLRKVIDVSKEIGLCEGVQCQPWLIKQEDEVFDHLHLINLISDTIEPNKETEEPDEAAASLIK